MSSFWTSTALEPKRQYRFRLTITSVQGAAIWFAKKVKAGLANINFGTYGSEPHMPFGGFGLSGNGTREPGLEALDVYSELKNISILNRPDLI